MKTLLTRLFVLCLFIGPSSAVFAQDRTPLPGHIAYVGTDSNIYTLDLEDYQQNQLTDDAGQTRQYSWPTWSNDGRLAYFSLAVEEGQLVTAAYVSADGVTNGEQVYSGPELFNYAYWSPGNCDAGANCRDLAVLLSSQTRGMFVELIRDGLDQASNLVAGTGGPPFYYSWSPDGGRMLWQRNNQRLDIYDASQDRITNTLDEIPGRILAPAWSPVDDRLLFGKINADQTTDLVVVGNDETTVLAPGIEQFVSYGWSPDGKQVAYRELSQNGYGPLIIVDSVTGQTVARSPSTGVIAFFWSPDSQRVAYITLATPPASFEAQSASNHLLAQTAQQAPEIAWSVLNVDGSEVRRFGSFVPTSETVYLLTYFDQFAQSHRIWSPDSRHLLYSELTANGPAVIVLDVTQENSVPFSIAEGVIGIWSFE